MTDNFSKSQSNSHFRKRDPYLDRRQGDDRRQTYSLFYFSEGGVERRLTKERRLNYERRRGYARVSTWASVCLSPSK